MTIWMALAVAAGLLAPTGGWRLAAEVDQCALSHDFGPREAPTRLSFVPSLVKGGAEMTVSIPAADAKDSEAIGSFLSVSAGAESVPTRLYARVVNDGADRRAVALPLLREVWEAFGNFRTISLKIAGTDVTLQMPPADRAQALLKICADDLVKSWGFNPAAFRAANPPRPKGRPIGRYFGSDSYPTAARKKKQTGRVGALAMITADGRMTQCRIVHPAGPDLDAQTCRVVRDRVYWKPATDEAGRAVDGVYEFNVV